MLMQAIKAANRAGCVRLLGPLNEQARRALYPDVAQKATELDKALGENFSASRRKLLDQDVVAGLALLGTATLGELKKCPFRHLPDDLAARILTDRQPPWLADWAEFELERNTASWPLVRRLVRDEVIPRPKSDFYILGMIAAPTGSSREFIKRDLPLLDFELWRLFEVEGSGELSLAASDKYAQEPQTWLAAFCAMVRDGVIDRERVLTLSLEALSRDFAPFRAGWFSRLHEALKPTRTERAAFRRAYLDLLPSRVPATVSFAMKALVELEKAGALHVAEEMERLAPALEARDKGTVQRALSLLGKAVRAHGAPSGLRPRVAALAARALVHEAPEVQTAALELAEWNRALAEPYLAVLAPSVRARLRKDGDDQVEPASAIPAAKRVASPSPQQVAPVASEEELVERFASVLENQGPPMDIERVLDGVARIPAGERLTASLAGRAAKLLAARDQPQPRSALAELALAWTRGQRMPQPDAEDSLVDFLVWRVWYLAEQAAQRVVKPLLSLPTRPDGRIDKAVFDERWRALSARDRAAADDRESQFHLDLVLARLRAGIGVGEAGGLRLLPKLTWRKRTWEIQGQTYSHHEPSLLLAQTRPASRFDPAWLTLAKLRGSPELFRWCATVCPVWREGWFAAGCREIGFNLNWDSAIWANRVYLETLAAESDGTAAPVGPFAALLIALGLAAKETGEAMLAVDSLIASVEGGRLDGGALGEALAAAASSGAILFTRVARQLAKAAQAGPRVARAIFGALELLFESGAGTAAADYGRLIEFAHELSIQTGLRLTRPGVRVALGRIKTGGKASKALAALAAIT